MSLKGKERASDDEWDGEGGEIEEGEAQPEAEGGEDEQDNQRRGEDGSLEAEVDEWDQPSARRQWVPQHVMDRPLPPTREERDAELALLEAQARAGAGTNDPRAKARVKPRRTIDYFGPLARWKLLRTLATTPGSVPALRPQPNYVIDVLPPQAYSSNASTSYCTKYVHTSTNKIRTPVNCVRWTPEGRRVLTGSASGEFTLWNGLTFNFETILQAHDCAIRSFEWSYSGSWLVSCDTSGVVKYFQPNMNNVSAFNGHNEPIRDISFAPDDSRFVTGSDDGSVKIWDFERRELDKSLTGHGYDVRCVKWHPYKSLLVSGSKNNLIKFWDPRTGTDLRTLHDHKNTIQAVSWSPNGNMVASAGRDQSIKIFDIRMMKIVQDFRGDKEACSVAWHPVHHNHLVSGTSEGSLQYWHLDSDTPVDSVDFAHEGQIWSMAYHPLGHLLATGSSDHTTRWWSRGRPGAQIAHDRFHVGRDKAKELGAREEDEEQDDEFAGALPGIGRGGQQYGNNAGYGPRFSGNNSYAPNTNHYDLPPASSGGGFSIPGLDPSARAPAAGSIPGLAAMQQMQAQAAGQNHSMQQGGPPSRSRGGPYRGRGGFRQNEGRGGAGKYSNAAASQRYNPY